MGNKTYCESLVEEIVSYSENELSIDRKEEIRNHVQSCANCKKHLKHFQKIKGVINKGETIETPPKFMNKILTEIARSHR